MRRALAEHAEDMLRYMLDNSDDVRRIVVGRKKLVRDLQMNPTTVPSSSATSKSSAWSR